MPGRGSVAAPAKGRDALPFSGVTFYLSSPGPVGFSRASLLIRALRVRCAPFEALESCPVGSIQGVVRSDRAAGVAVVPLTFLPGGKNIMPKVFIKIKKIVAKSI